MNNAETNAQISKILSDLKNCQENLLNETLIISEEPRILDERVLPSIPDKFLMGKEPYISPRAHGEGILCSHPKQNIKPTLKEIITIF